MAAARLFYFSGPFLCVCSSPDGGSGFDNTAAFRKLSAHVRTAGICQLCRYRRGLNPKEEEKNKEENAQVD